MKSYYCTLLNFTFLERVSLAKSLLAEKNLVISVKNIAFLNILRNLVDNYKRLGVLLDGDCPDAKILLKRCHKYKVFDTKHFWLVFHNSSNYEYLFESANLHVDSDVKIVYPSEDTASNFEENYLIDDVYNPGYDKGGRLITKKIGFYDTFQGYRVNESENKYFSRKNLSGINFLSLIVLSEPYEKPLKSYLKKDRNIEVDTLNRFHARLLEYCRSYHNFSIDFIGVTNSWGYYQPDGTMDGVVGALARKQIDFGYSPLVIKKERAKFITFGKGTWHLRMAFVFRNPNLKRSFEIFIKPLSFEVWMCIISSSILLILAQKLGVQLDYAMAHLTSKSLDGDTSWSSCILCSLAGFCQQGVFLIPFSLNGRTISLTILWLGLLIYQFYSASLVSFLLNVPVTPITTVQGILDSDFGIGYENVLYAKSILKATTSNEGQEIYRRVSVNNESGFLKRDEGMMRVKKGHYAFHVELVTGYPYIDRHFDLPMICELKEIPLFPRMYMYSGYEKWSSFKDVIDICLQRFEENGVIARELQFWHPRKPKCVRTPATIKINTSLEEFYPALVIWIFGVAASVGIFLLEMIYHRIKENTTFEFIN
ncbi:hypothetical protein ABEB36_002964 [Hypothenemus hampei]|uniref:Ionotropic receptor 75a N-terminal domain-containing protein n=1 Tax=Hypothenemus hampei TaxID=57062 RepID=A0ABD1F7M1_HYPHA